METAKRVASKAAVASPRRTSEQDNQRVAAFIIFLKESLRIAAVHSIITPHCHLKFPLKQPKLGGHKREGRVASLQAATWKSIFEAICLRALAGSGLISS
ncbi:hypothetical protein SLA2020_420930 [Shorea laevis]